VPLERRKLRAAAEPVARALGGRHVDVDPADLVASARVTVAPVALASNCPPRQCPSTARSPPPPRAAARAPARSTAGVVDAHRPAHHRDAANNCAESRGTAHRWSSGTAPSRCRTRRANRRNTPGPSVFEKRRIATLRMGRGPLPTRSALPAAGDARVRRVVVNRLEVLGLDAKPRRAGRRERAATPRTRSSTNFGLSYARSVTYFSSARFSSRRARTRLPLPPPGSSPSGRAVRRAAR
jgi:hypothetical protein